MTLRSIGSDMVSMGATQSLGGGKSDVLEVERVTSWRWKERCLVCVKRDVLDVARAMLRGIKSDVVAMGVTLQDVAIAIVL